MSLPREVERPNKRLRVAGSSNGLPASHDPTHKLKQRVEDAEDVLRIMERLPKPHTLAKTGIPFLLPEADSTNKTLVLDLDNTIICTKEISNLPPNFENPSPGTFYLTCNDGTQFFGRSRPHLEEFLNRASAKYEIVIFTAGTEGYAAHIRNFLDPKGSLIAHCLSWNACKRMTLTNGKSFFTKDLSVLGRNLSGVVMVDDLPPNFVYQFDNGIPVKPWRGTDCEDRELLALASILEDLAKVQDVRPVIAETFALHRVIHTAWEQHPDSFPFRATSEEQPDVVSGGEGEDEGSTGLAAGTHGDETGGALPNTHGARQLLGGCHGGS
eukprot:jgi/Botrbrau1/13451/Bobra.0082s0054.1